MEIYELLYRLGVTANYTGFFYTAYAVRLCAEHPDRLMLVTKWVYPDVAKRYRTNWKAVKETSAQQATSYGRKAGPIWNNWQAEYWNTSAAMHSYWRSYPTVCSYHARLV